MTCPPRVQWMRHCDVFPDLKPSNTDWVALDGDRIVGRVMQFDSGPESGRWMWSMVATAPGPTILPANGRAETRTEAAMFVVAAYEQLLSR